MKDEYFGDSFDIVKRFFVRQLRSSGFAVTIDPTYLEDMAKADEFVAFVGAHAQHVLTPNDAVLFLDPDTGIGSGSKRSHITIQQIADLACDHAGILCYDQSFAHAKYAETLTRMKAKLEEVEAHNVSGFYYDSHARFLFASKSHDALDRMRSAILVTGLPVHRLVSCG